jgi:hypothetical protein
MQTRKPYVRRARTDAGVRRCDSALYDYQGKGASEMYHEAFIPDLDTNLLLRRAEADITKYTYSQRHRRVEYCGAGMQQWLHSMA